MARARVDVDDLATKVRAGERAAIARAITLVESTRPDHREQASDLLSRLAAYTGRAGGSKPSRTRD